MDFQTIKTAVAAQFAKMAKAKLLRVSLNKDALWEQYLQAFPAGTNPIFRERTEHDYTCCKERKQQLMALLNEKQTEELRGKSSEEIQALIAAL